MIRAPPLRVDVRTLQNQADPASGQVTEATITRIQQGGPRMEEVMVVTEVMEEVMEVDT